MLIAVFVNGGNFGQKASVCSGMKMSNQGWATDEFGGAQLGDARRQRRLVAIAARAVGRPAGRITDVFSTSAEREAAYRLLENEALAHGALAKSAHQAAARRCSEHANVVVPIDGSSLNLRDPAGRRGLGPVGTRSAGALGVLVMTALALDPQGTPLGLLDQHYWTRSLSPPKRATRRRGSKHDKRPRQDRESFIWVESMRRVAETMSLAAPRTRPWFQLDRGADCMSVLIEAADAGMHLTVRAVHDRCLRWHNGRDGRLLSSMVSRPVSGTYKVDVPERPKQVAREATMAIRVARMPLLLRLGKKRRRILTVTVILATEQHVPRGQIPLRWMLFTTHAVETTADALVVVGAYSRRWRIEDFHKTWKTGACDIESSKLESKDNIIRWATIMASVAARIENIKHAARTTPDAPATTVFSLDEIEATILLYKVGVTKINVPYKQGDIPTVAEITRWIASLGGHMGNPKKRPPGPTVIRRGLERIAVAATVLAAQRQGKM
jgi:Transposase DNA-binding/Transposase DDE domain